MRRRLYFVLPDLLSARQTVEDLLLARIDARHIRVLAKRGIDIGDLPEASVFQKTDLVHGAQVGTILGALGGVLLGVLLVAYPPGDVNLQPITILVTALVGAGFGSWSASLAGASVPNSKLTQFQQWIDQGKLLLMADVPFAKADAVTEVVLRRHPEALPGGTDPTIPAFP